MTHNSDIEPGKHDAASRRKTMLQFLRYATVGVMNTLLTLVVIFICKDFFHINIWVSNALGYIAGFINSFVWNKLWVFHSGGRVMREVVRFVGGFLICYALQLAATWCLNTLTPLRDMIWDLYGYTLSGYGVATLAGMVVYTVANFFYNRAVTFRD